MQTVSAFCDAQEIKDVDNFIYLCFKQGFDIKKYGLLGKTLNDGEKDLKTGGIEEKRVEIEVIREKRVEIPVEVIKEVVKVEYVEVPVEVIKEVPVDKIVEVIKEVPVDRVVIQEVIKEIPVEKIVTIYDNSSENELLLKIQQLENRPPEIVEVEKIVEIEKEVEKIVEVIKEVVVEKTTTDNSKQKALEETIQKIRTELQLKNKEINDLKLTISDIQKQGGSKGVYMDGSNLGKILR